MKTVLQNIEHLEENTYIDTILLNAFIKKTKTNNKCLGILDSKIEETDMWHHIKILNNMFTIIECTSHTELIYEILDVTNHGLEFA